MWLCNQQLGLFADLTRGTLHSLPHVGPPPPSGSPPRLFGQQSEGGNNGARSEGAHCGDIFYFSDDQGLAEVAQDAGVSHGEGTGGEDLAGGPPADGVCPASAMLFMMFRVKLAHFLVPLPSTPALFDTMARHNAPHTSTLRLQKM